MEVVKVYSPVDDSKIRENINDSPIWKKAYTDYELPEAKKVYPVMYEYSFKFDGLKPVQFTGVKKLVD